MKRPKFSSGADISTCNSYRYSLWRIWDVRKETVLFVCLNPSTADATQDDPTIRRCIGYAKDWGFGGFYMANLFAYRATEPKEMKKAFDPIGPLNNEFIKSLTKICPLVICGWGDHGKFKNRARAIIHEKILPSNIHYLKLNKSGMPSHPLYLKKDLTPQLYTL